MDYSIDSFENNSFSVENKTLGDKLKEFNKSYDSKIKSVEGIYKSNNFSSSEQNIEKVLGKQDFNINRIPMDSVVTNVKQMYGGKRIGENDNTLGIKEISTWKGDSYSNQRSRAGFAGEVVSTARENMQNDALGNGNKTYRADDRPDLYQKNDQYVDKIRVDANDNIIERVQTKFIGKDGSDCAKKLMGKKYDKYFDEGKVDKIEIPKDFYDDAKKYYEDRRESVNKQIESAKERGDDKTLEAKTAELEKINKRDSMLEQSNTKLSEAMQASKNPNYFSAKTMIKPMLKDSAKEGLHQAEEAMIITGAISTVDNVSKYMDGDISAEEAVKNIAVDTGTAGAGAFGVEFVTSATCTMMKNSSNSLIRKVGNVSRSNTAALAVSYGVEVHETVIDYARGNIDNREFADELGRSAAKVAGGAVGSSVGRVAGPIGSYYGAQIGSEVGEISYEATKTVVKTGIEVVQGDVTIDDASAQIEEAVYDAADKTVETVEEHKDSAVELVSKTVDYVVTTEAYATAVQKYEGVVDAHSEEITKLENKAKECSDKVIEKASVYGQDAVNEVKSAINNFNLKNSIPFKV